MRAVDIKGQTFHYLTAIKPVGSSKSGVVWECRCKCGKTTKTTAKNLRSGNTKSCGCLNSERVALQTHWPTGRVKLESAKRQLCIASRTGGATSRH